MNVTDIKAAVRTRDGLRCTECGMTNENHKRLTGRQLEVHRLTPGSAYTLDGCVTLCRTCHAPKPRSPHRSQSVGLDLQLYRQIEVLAERNAMTALHEIRTAIRERLERADLWPPPHPAPGEKPKGRGKT